MARQFYNDREKMTLVSEEDGVVFRTTEKKDGLLSLTEMTVSDITPEDIMAFAYNMADLIPRINKSVTMEIVKEEGPYMTVLERLELPLVTKNRAFIATTYHIHHKNDEEGYTLLRSSVANEDISLDVSNTLNKEIIGDLIMYRLNIKPLL